MNTKLKEGIRRVVYRFIKPPFIPASYSQAGEDAVIRFLFGDMGFTTIKYLDIGAHSPQYGNNTYLFYTDGSTGVCVEADVSLIENIQTKRPKDKVLNVGVAVSEEKEADFYIFNTPGINTFDKEEAEKRARSGNFKLLNVVKVPLVNINQLIKENFSTYPDYLSMDIEGLDLPVLKSLDFSLYPIPVICVETCVYSETHIRAKDQSIAEFMATKGYEVYADTYVNTIFINKEWFYSTTKKGI